MDDLFQLGESVLDSARAVAPWFFLSIGLGVSVRALRLAAGLEAVLRHRPLQAVLVAAVLGAVTPFCSCTVVPVVAGLLLAGVPLAPVMTFWVASPTMDPEIFTLTVAMLGWPLALSRLLATVLLSVGAGVGVLALARRGLLHEPLRRSVGSADAAHPLPVDGPSTVPGAVVTPPGTLRAVREPVRTLDRLAVVGEVLAESWRLGRWLLVAFALEASILAYVPQERIVSVLGAGNPLSVPLAALVGVPLYLGNLTALPIVSGLLDRGMSPGAAIAFLLAGPVTTVPAMVAVRSVVRTPVFVFYLLVGLLGSLVLGVIAGVVLG